MAAVTICSDFGAQKNKVSHCFHCYPINCTLTLELPSLIFGSNARDSLVWNAELERIQNSKCVKIYNQEDKAMFNQSGDD